MIPETLSPKRAKLDVFLQGDRVRVEFIVRGVKKKKEHTYWNWCQNQNFSSFTVHFHLLCESTCILVGTKDRFEVI